MKDLEQTELFPTQKKSTSLQEDTLANLSALQVEKKVKKIRDISGQSILDLSKSSGQLGLLEKTLVDTLNSVLTPLSKTWKLKVTPLGRLVFQLRASAPTTKEKESGLWLTPSTTVISNRSPEAMEKRKQFRKSIGRNTVNPGNLAEQIQYGNKTTDMKMWRTPDNIAGGSNLPGIKKALDEGHLKRPSGQPMQIRLQDQVREERLHPQPQKWPTPTANEDAAGRPTGKMQKMLGNHPDVRGMGGGTLNPTWVEWLMGYPKGWTDLNLSVTPWFPPSPTTSDSASSSPTWPTPMARSHSTPRLPETMAKTGRNPLTNTLEDAVQYREIEKRKKWPTPLARDVKDLAVKPSWKESLQPNLPREVMKEEEKKKIKTGKGPGMWLTPRANEIQESYETYIKRMRKSPDPKNNTKTRPNSLSMQVKMWPTPTNQSAGKGKMLDTLITKDGEKAKRGERAYNPKTGKHVQITLDRAVKMWPTPTANDGKRGEINKDGTVKETWKKRKDRWAAKGVNMHRPLDIAVALDEEENKDENKNKNVANTKSD